jgi:hypothetical protein
MREELERVQYEIEDAWRRGVSKVTIYCEHREYIQKRLGGVILSDNKAIEFILRNVEQ